MNIRNTIAIIAAIIAIGIVNPAGASPSGLVGSGPDAPERVTVITAFFPVGSQPDEMMETEEIPQVSVHPYGGMTLTLPQAEGSGFQIQWCTGERNTLVTVDLNGPVYWVAENPAMCNYDLMQPARSIVSTDPTHNVAFVVIEGEVYAGRCYGNELRATKPSSTMEPELFTFERYEKCPTLGSTGA